ncbi:MULTISPECIES: AAA family ATPase [Mammaliicoccus]|uniref:AAA family ATPase n=1 Tax=Mammaliicoccus sciuri TaxID=1296 RepID=A0ABT7HYK2_MAMSC|nr:MULTISPECIES: AAA family ATPase [Mammaliicoccus]MCJ0914556.1 AAA family ATPase [Mammaliicoccus sciuri]MDL0112653.1 AAA family ATPase [Mammaliicoccus sciuri]MDL0117227.1 AAA family ATPase [Mammaliicoccus sciuri]WQJ65990.1 AAA family ATPase [Mammaliicoccus sciuri]
MKLKYMKIRNFRGYKNLTEINFNDITAFIGKNDAGKSTILEALEIFFNNSLVVCEKEDLSINADSENIEISCVFEDLPDEITLDSTSKTTLKKEFLLNTDGDLEIKKVFKASVGKPKSKIYIVCNYPTVSPYNKLINMKRSELRTTAKELKVPEELYNANSNVSIRGAIFNEADNLDLDTQDVAVDYEDSKKVYEVLEKYLPIFSLFQSDRSSRDNDKEVVDPMSIAIKEALKELESEIEKIKIAVKDKALETANRTLEKLQEMDSELATALTPEFKTDPKFESQFKLTIQADDGISVNKRGSGVRRLILLNFFRAEVERKLIDETSQNVIYAFEEPETSQHPKHQEMLIKSFLDLANNTNSQVILTTHTPSLAGLLPLESLRFVTKEGKHRIVKSNNEEVYEEIAETLGLLPEPFTNNTKAILLVEGKGDVIFINHLCNKLKEGGSIDYTLQEKGFAILPTGGCTNLKAWRTIKVVEQFQLPWCVLLDSDKETQDENRNVKIINKLKSEGIKAYLTRRREPENYIHKDCFEQSVSFSETDDAKKIINQITGVAASKVLEKFWPKMTFEQIKEMEKYTNNNGDVKYEFTEMISDFLTITM